MAYLSQASSPVADFSKCVISFLARVPQANVDALTGTSILEFGTPDVSTTVDNFSGQALTSHVLILSDGSVSFQLFSVKDGVTVTNTLGNYPVATAGASYQTPAQASPGDTWRRYIISLDVSSGASFNYDGVSDFTLVSNGYRLWVSVDDVDYSPTSFFFLLNEHTSQPAGSFMPQIWGSYDGENTTFPNFTIALSGLEFAILCLAANAAPGYNLKVQMADIMMWTGVSLDTSVTANRRLFIDAAGNPVNPSVAIAALGTPVYDFRGPASGISTNRGSAGSVTKTGTVTNYTPGP